MNHRELPLALGSDLKRDCMTADIARAAGRFSPHVWETQSGSAPFLEQIERVGIGVNPR